jgi:hypothetical protein
MATRLQGRRNGCKMKRSQFIQVALIDQMQQIADLGLWYHLATLLSKGVGTLSEIQEDAHPPHHRDSVMPTYKKIPPVGKSWRYQETPEFLFCSNPDDAHLDATFSEEGAYYIHVPTFFEHFKNACKIIIESIEAGEIEDSEIIKITE